MIVEISQFSRGLWLFFNKEINWRKKYFLLRKIYTPVDIPGTCRGWCPCPGGSPSGSGRGSPRSRQSGAQPALPSPQGGSGDSLRGTKTLNDISWRGDAKGFYVHHKIMVVILYPTLLAQPTGWIRGLSSWHQNPKSYFMKRRCLRLLRVSQNYGSNIMSDPPSLTNRRHQRTLFMAPESWMNYVKKPFTQWRGEAKGSEKNSITIIPKPPVPTH